jgi:hypothetical protein
MVGPGATDGDQAPAERLASQRAASLRALFPTGTRSTTPPPEPEPEPAPPPEVTPDAPAPRRRRLPVVAAVAAAFAVGIGAGVAAVTASGNDSPDKPLAAPASAGPLRAGPYDGEPTASTGPETAAAPTVSATPTGPPSTPTPPAATTAPPPSPTKPAGRPNPSRANLALNRPVTASGSEGHPWPPGAVVDGKPDTRWSSAFTDRQWIAIDLGQAWSVSQVRLAWEHAHATRYTVEVSLDAKAWSKVYTTSSGVGGTVDVDTGPMAARYVRLVCTKRSGSYGYSLFEIEVR